MRKFSYIMSTSHIIDPKKFLDFAHHSSLMKNETNSEEIAHKNVNYYIIN